jgi:histidinol-phosphate aminotransferase
MIDFIDLKRGCNPFSPVIPQALLNTANLNYDDNSDYLLIHTLAQFYQVKESQIMIENGSARVLQWLFQQSYDQVFLIKDDFYLNEELASFYQHTPHIIARNIEALEKNIAQSQCHHKNLFMLTWLNNYDGGLIDLKTILRCARLLKKNSPLSILVLDGAYMEYANNLTMILEALKEPNIIYTGTFSKAYGIACMRVGYAISRLFEEEIKYKKLLYMVPSLSARMAAYLMQDQQFLNDTLSYVQEQKNLFCQNNHHCIDTQGHRILYQGEQIDALIYFLLRNRFLVKKAIYDNQAVLSFSMGQPEENKTLLSLLNGWEKKKIF